MSAKPWELTFEAEKAPWEQDFNLPKPQGGIMGAAALGTKSLLSSQLTGIKGIFGNANEAAQAGVTRQEELGQQYVAPTSLEAVKKAYQEKGLLSAAGEVATQIPKAIAQQAPQLAETFAGAAAGTMVAGPWGAVVGAALPNLVQFFGTNLERQAQEQIKSGQPVNVEAGKAALAAIPQTAVDLVETRLLFGSKFLSGALGISEKSLTKMSTEAVEKQAQEKLLPLLLKGTAKGVATEIPSEIAQQMLERAQAGLSLTSPDAIVEYGNTAYQVGLLGPLGTVGRAGTRGEARTELSKREGVAAADAAIAAEQAKMAMPTPPDQTGQMGINLVGGQEAAGPRQQLPIQQEQPLVGPEQPSPQMELDFEQPYPKSPLQAAPTIIGQAEQPKPPQVSDLDWAKMRLQSGAPLSPAQQFLLQEDKAKQQTAFQNAPTPQLEIPNVVGAGARPTSYVVDDRVIDSFGVTKAANAFKNAVRGLDLMNPDDAAKFDDLVAKHERKNAKINMDAVEAFKAEKPEPVAAREVPEQAGIPARPYDARKAYQQAREAQFAFGQVAAPLSPRDVRAQAEAQYERDNGTRPISRADERGVPVPSVGVSPTEGATAPESTGMASPVGVTERPDGGATPSGANGPATLVETAQHVRYGDSSKGALLKLNNGKTIEITQYGPNEWIGPKGIDLGITLEEAAATVIAMETTNPLPAMDESRRVELLKALEDKATQRKNREERRKNKVVDLTDERKAKSEEEENRLDDEDDALEAKEAFSQMAKQVAPAEKLARRLKVVPRVETKEALEDQLAREPVSADTEALMKELGIAKSERDSILGRNTPELEAEVADGNAKGALKVLATSDKFTALDNLLAQGLLDSNKTFPAIEIVPKGFIKGTAPGQYDSRIDTVQITEGQVDSHTVLHEVSHGSLHSMIIADMQRVAEGKPANPMLKDLKDVYNHAVQTRPDLVASGEYGMKDLSEFSSEIWSNPKFQLEMANTPYKVMNILTAFGRKVVKLLTGIDLPSGKVGQVKANILIAGLIAVQKAMPQGRNVQEVRGAQIGAGIAPIQVSTAPTGIPQKIWDLHEKHLVAQANARTWNYGAAKREMTMSFRRLNEAVKTYTNNDDAAGLKLMQQMNEESSRREEQEVPKVQRTPQGQDAESLMSAFGGKPEDVKQGFVQKQVSSFNKAKDTWTEAYEQNNDWVASTFGKAQNIASFDQAFNNRLYNHFMGEAKKGNMVMEDAKKALLRVSTSQALHRGNLANQIIEKGDYIYDAPTNRWDSKADPVNMTAFESLIKSLATKLGVEPTRARQIMGAAYEANRLNGMYKSLDQTEKDIASLEVELSSLRKNRKRTKADQKEIDLKTARLGKLRTLEEDLNGKVRHKTKAQVDAGMELYNAYSEIKEGTKVWNTMRERVVKLLVETGVKTEEEAQRWLDEAAYVPFFRDMEDQKAAGPQVMARGLRESMVDRTMKGSMREVQDPIENMYQWMQWSIARAISNKQLQVMLDNYKEALPNEVRSGEGGHGNTFTIYYDGTQRKFNVADPAIAQAFVGLEPIIFPGIGAAVSATNALRHIITRFPLFSAVQLFSDSYTAMYTSGLKSPFGVLKEIAKEVAKTAQGTSETRKMLIGKGILETHDYTAMNEEDAIAKRLDLDNPSSWKKLMRNLDRLSSASDNVIRQGVYNQAIKEKLSHEEAMEKAAEIVNFRRISGDPRLQFASRVIPFFNAYLQVGSVAIKTLSGRGISPTERKAAQATLIATTAKIAVLSMLYSMAIGDDEDYKRKNRVTRDRMFMIPGTGGMGIPIRSDVFALPKVIGEYTYQMMSDNGTTDSKMFKQAMSRAVMNSLHPPSEGIPQVVRPALGVMTNHDFFQDREIVNATMRRLDTDRQFTKSTSEMAKALGTLTGMSPLNIEYLLRGYFGSAMTLTALATDDAINAARGGPPRPAKSAGDMLAALPNMSGFVSKDENTAVLSDFYEVARDVNKASATLKSMKHLPMEEQRAYREEHQKELRLKPMVHTIEKQLVLLKQREQLVRESSKMDDAKKQIELKRIADQRDRMVKNVAKVRQKMYD